MGSIIMIKAEDIKQDREIYFCNIYLEYTVKKEKKVIKLEKVVYKHTDGWYAPRDEKYSKLGKLRVIGIDVIVKLGKANNYG